MPAKKKSAKRVKKLGRAKKLEATKPLSMSYGRIQNQYGRQDMSD